MPVYRLLFGKRFVVFANLKNVRSKSLNRPSWVFVNVQMIFSDGLIMLVLRWGWHV